MNSQPSAFLNAPDSNAYRPAPTPITQTQEARVPYVTPVITPMQLRFIEEYPKDFKKPAAARRAGCAPQSAGRLGYEWYLLPHIRAAIDARIAELSPEEVNATLSVSIDNHCTLSKRLLASVPKFRMGSPVQLIVPSTRGGLWYLDTQPKPGAGQRLPASPTARAVFRVPPVGRHHFIKSAVQQAPAADGKRRRLIAANKNTQATLLRFRLGAQVPGHPGYYELVAIPNGGVNQ